MADSAISISEMTSVPISRMTDLIEVAAVSGEGYTSGKMTAQTLGNGINNTFEYATLETEAKAIISAINELKSRIDALEGGDDE